MRSSELGASEKSVIRHSDCSADQPEDQPVIATEQFPPQAPHASSSHSQGLLAQSRTLAKWCACALVLLLPGSFIVLALLWLYRRCA